MPVRSDSIRVGWQVLEDAGVTTATVSGFDPTCPASCHPISSAPHVAASAPHRTRLGNRPSASLGACLCTASRHTALEHGLQPLHLAVSAPSSALASSRHAASVLADLFNEEVHGEGVLSVTL